MISNFEERLSGSPFVDRIWRTQSEPTGDFLSVAASQWEKLTLIKENLSDEIGKLKAQPGKNIGVGGSPTLVRSLLRDSRLDELLRILCLISYNTKTPQNESHRNKKR